MKKNIILEKIEDVLLNYQNVFNTSELEEIKIMIKNFSGKDAELKRKISKEKNGKNCVAFLLEENLCKGTGNEEPCFSHVVAENQIEKFKKHNIGLNKISNLMFDVLINKIIEANPREPIFVGFCPACEKSFTQANEINIDTEVNMTKFHMFKLLYRFLGKEITGYTEFIKFLKDVNQSLMVDKRKDIDKNIFNLFLEKLKNSNLEKEINNHILHKLYLKSLFLDVAGFIENKDNIKINNSKEAYKLITAEVDSKKLQLIGQSLTHYPLFFKDIKFTGFIFFNFLLDEEEKLTKCYMLIQESIFNEIEKNCSFPRSNEKKAIFIVLLAFLNTNELYFSNEFKNKNRIEIENLIGKVNKNDNMIEQFQFLINFINNGKIKL